MPNDELLDMFDVESHEETEAQTPDAEPDPVAEAEKAAQADDTPAEAPAEPTEEPTEATQEVKPPDTSGTTTTPAEESEKDAEPDDITDIVGPDGKYMTYREAAKATRSLQSMKDREMDELRGQMQQQQQYIEQQAAMQQQQSQQQSIESVSDEQIVKGLAQNPHGTFNWLAEAQPHRVSEAISAIREIHGNEMADEAITAYNQNMIQGTQQQMQAQHDEMLRPGVVQSNIQSAMGALSNKYGDEFNDLSDDVAGIVESFEGIDFDNPQAIANALETGFLHAWRAKATTGASNPATPDPSPREFVESGTPGQEPVETAEEGILNDIVGEFNKQYR